MSELKIEEGKWYRRRDGAVLGPMVRGGDPSYPFQVGNNELGRDDYTETGMFQLGYPGCFDLVEEVPAPLPQHPVDIAIASELDAETVATTFGPSEDYCRAPAAEIDPDGLFERAFAETATTTFGPVEDYVPPDSAWQPAPDSAWQPAAESEDEFDPVGRIAASLGGEVTYYDKAGPAQDYLRSGSFIPDQKTADLRRAVDIASKAATLVGGDRDRQHGAKHDNFRRIAGVWNAWLSIRKDPAAPLDAHDVGCMMAMMKLARTQSGALNVDDYVDACGYAACAGEVAQLNDS